ncbi:hypothetical protein CC77DRAFT_390393 [Alternaria alternata]|uniref:Zn(2)-C6 fungal-type domain-containing protein n=1 Tax=Alternaria alternata TaxID=5599 RepID=A0A177D907_ALTAL|nr:hypothetical protein CC77DRAFT_390393 [Alternaria alternata]OAG16175.1 hypothetical protein CC77DRAFT_390393 [Alternaria alternata]RYN47010.1 hypothetical protein AA0118_g12318 [Alternaria tenuissima]
MQEAGSGERIADRQCWECLKRRLVCDRTLPLCKKCPKAGKECPGYNEQKPLQWLEPGKVSLRPRKRNSPPKKFIFRPRTSGTSAAIVASVPVAAPCEPSEPGLAESISQEPCLTLAYPLFERSSITSEAIEIYESHLASLLVQEDRAAWWHDLDVEKRVKHITLMATEAAAASGVGERIMRIGNQDQIKEVVERGQYWEAAALLQSNRDPLAKIQRLLRVMQANKLPSYDFLSDETCEVVHAVNYFNTRIYPYIKETDALAPNPAIIRFPVWALHVLPPAVHYTTVCLSINHYMHSLPPGSSGMVIGEKRLKIYNYRGLAIRALNESIARKETRSSDLTITSILMFMAMEVHDSKDGDWRSHADGMKQLIDIRGGFQSLLRAAPHLTSALVVFVIIVTFSNTLGPVSRQLNITEPLEQHIKEVEKVYSLVFPYTLCPVTLFIDIIRINRLRQEVALSSFADQYQHSLNAQNILARIEGFIPGDWAQAGENQDDWQLIGSIYQSATALYCIMSLQALVALPASTEMNSTRTDHAKHLLENMKAALHLKQLKKIAMFPLCVLGVEAGYHDQQRTRLWIERQLEGHARLLGTSSPLKARAVLRRYWRWKRPGWNECFDEPFTILVPAGAC